MCEYCCGHREKLKEKPEECREEQIEECHDDIKDYPYKNEDKLGMEMTA